MQLLPMDGYDSRASYPRATRFGLAQRPLGSFHQPLTHADETYCTYGGSLKNQQEHTTSLRSFHFCLPVSINIRPL